MVESRKSMTEKDFQKAVIKTLRSYGCIVIKYQQNATTMAGVADIIFMKEGFWGAIEVKKSKNAKIRAGQKEFIEKCSKWSWGAIIYPENWEEKKKELKYYLGE